VQGTARTLRERLPIGADGALTEQRLRTPLVSLHPVMRHRRALRVTSAKPMSTEPIYDSGPVISLPARSHPARLSPEIVPVRFNETPLARPRLRAVTRIRSSPASAAMERAPRGGPQSGAGSPSAISMLHQTGARSFAAQASALGSSLLVDPMRAQRRCRPPSKQRASSSLELTQSIDDASGEALSTRADIARIV